jgi:hypothetical protein
MAAGAEAGAAWMTYSVARVEAATVEGATAGVAKAVAVTAARVTTGAVWASISGWWHQIQAFEHFSHFV